MRAVWNQITPSNLRVSTFLDNYENLPLNTFDEAAILQLVAILEAEMEMMPEEEQFYANFENSGLETHPMIVWVAEYLDQRRMDRNAANYRRIAERDQARLRNELQSPRQRTETALTARRRRNENNGNVRNTRQRTSPRRAVRYRVGRYAPSA